MFSKFWAKIHIGRTGSPPPDPCHLNVKDAVSVGRQRNAQRSARIASVDERASHAQSVTPSTSQASLPARLREPDLSPGRAAAAIPVSERYLFALFQETGTTPAAGYETLDSPSRDDS
jgi:hypothetical protein